MKVFFDPRQLLHRPRSFIARGLVIAGPEVPERAEAFLAAVRELGCDVVAPPRCGRAPLLRVHAPEYLEFLEHGHARWAQLPGAGPEIIPNIHPNRHMSARPGHIVGEAGQYMADGACPIGADTWTSAVASAGAAIAAARSVLDGARHAYALCRPPGHHAYADLAGGFCYLNNIALAAEELRTRLARVAIIDVDVHHGNGTQGIFYRRDDVFCASLHADPTTYYPWYAGHADERGEGAGLGCNLNLPLAHGTGDDGVLAAVDAALAAINRFGPDALLVALGLDAAADDPLGVLKVTREGFRAMGARIGAFAGPVVLVQEGGYMSPGLGGNLASFLAGFADAHRH